jgi:N-acetylmuramoyl-L-alanine amidase
LYKKYKTAGYDCVFISIHINAAGGDGKWHNATGWSGWVAKKSSSNSKKLA